MSVFNEIANDVPTLVRHASTLLSPGLEGRDSARLSAAPVLIEELVGHARQQNPTQFSKLLDQLCLNEACRDALLRISGDEAQSVVDAIQLTLDDLRSTDDLYRHALYLLVKLSANTNILPTSLFVNGVDIGSKRDPCHGGAFADIYRGLYEGVDVAVKKLRFFGSQKAPIHQAFCKEALVWRQLAHPNVLPFIGVDGETFADTGFLCMVSPWMANGSLLDHKRSEDYNPEKDTIRILWEVSSGLAYLHGQKVAHGDIHASNIFVDLEGHAQLADFGLSIVGETTMGRMTSGSSSAGNTRYLAPERVCADENSRRTTASDVYAFACVCLFLYTGKHPFHEYPKDLTVGLKVMNGDRPARPSRDHCQPHMTDIMWRLIEEAWHKDPSSRPPMPQLEKRLRLVDNMINPNRSIRNYASGMSLPNSPRIAPDVAITRVGRSPKVVDDEIMISKRRGQSLTPRPRSRTAVPPSFYISRPLLELPSVDIYPNLALTPSVSKARPQPTHMSPPPSIDMSPNRSGTSTPMASSSYPRRSVFLAPRIPLLPGSPSPRSQHSSPLAPVLNFPYSGVSDGGDADDEVILVPRNTPRIRQLTNDENVPTILEGTAMQSTPTWGLKAQYAEEELKFDSDGTIKLGTIRALVEHLTDSQGRRYFRDVFFMTFRTFATADEIFWMLVGHYELSPPDGIMSVPELCEWKERKQRPTQIQVLTCLTTWLEDYGMLNEEPHLARQVQDFLSSIQQPLEVALAACIVLQSLSKLISASPIDSHAMGSFPARKQRLFSKDSNVLVRDPGNIAQHLTLLESKLYIQIKPQECLNWAKVQTGMTVTNILAFSSTRDKITKWVRSSVLKNDSLGKRADTVDFWVQVAEHCRTSNNYSSMSAVIAGLKNILPSRLPLTWTHISRASQFDTLTKINDPAGNFSVLRSLLDHVDRPCIPFVNIYLTDIVHCQDQFPDSTIGAAGHPFIHFQKRTKWADAVTSIVRHQAKLYQLPEDPITMSYIDSQLAAAEALDPASFWSRSQELQQAELAHADIRKGLEAAGF